MHFMQAIKMAIKSLWINKLRSFLTMLGIIIGVIAVSLLITVTQGVSNIIVSSIRSKSTLSIMLNISDKLTNKSARDIISNVQPTDKNADDYFDYSLATYTSSLIANDSLDGIDGDLILDFLTPERIYTMADFEGEDLTPEEEGIIKLLLMKKKGALKTNVYAIDKNYKDIYDLDFEGNYISNPNEILVDETFVDTYLGKDVSNVDAIGRVVTLGVNNYTNIKLVYDKALTKSNIKSIMDIVSDEYEIKTGEDENGNSIYNKVSLDIIENEDGSNYIYEEVVNSENVTTYELSINIEIIKVLTNDELKEKFLEISKKPLIASLFEGSEMIVKDVYEKNNAKEFTIVGVVDDDSNSIFSDILSNNIDKSNDEAKKTSIMKSYMETMTSSKGNCYMLLDDSNMPCIYEKEMSTNDAVVSFAYFRYKSEDVMSASTSNLVVSFALAGYGYMSEFVLVSFRTVADILSNVMQILTLLLAVISIVSLLVGGIGIMNIMLVSVTERTKEIGIRKAIGAKKSSILMQFLIESLFISIFGAIMGLIISAIGVFIISNIIGITIIMPPKVILLSVGFCSAIGLIFGMFPAIKASNMQPIDALRRE